MGNKKISAMREGGKILSDVLDEVLLNIVPGITELELNDFVEKAILLRGGKSGFKKVKGYKHTICVSTNNVVVHGIPTSRALQEGDLVGIDCGVYYKGYHTDVAETVWVPTIDNKQLTVDQKIDKFLAVGKRALFAGIRQATAGNRVGHISKAIQNMVEGAGYSVVRSLVGHGVGKNLHETPEIPGYLNHKISDTPPLFPGMTIAIEVIYNMGKPEVIYGSDDDWTISTQDGSLSGLFERTILITEKGPEILTRLSKDAHLLIN